MSQRIIWCGERTPHIWHQKGCDCGDGERVKKRHGRRVSFTKEVRLALGLQKKEMTKYIRKLQCISSVGGE